MSHPPSVFARQPMLTGVAVGIATLAPHFFLAPAASVGYAAIVLAPLPLVAIPQWYVPWCVVIDVIVGAGLLVIWRGHGVI